MGWVLRLSVFLVLAAAALAGCGGGGDEKASDTAKSQKASETGGSEGTGGPAGPDESQEPDTALLTGRVAATVEAETGGSAECGIAGGPYPGGLTAEELDRDPDQSASVLVVCFVGEGDLESKVTVAKIYTSGQLMDDQSEGVQGSPAALSCQVFPELSMCAGSSTGDDPG